MTKKTDILSPVPAFSVQVPVTYPNHQSTPHQPRKNIKVPEQFHFQKLKNYHQRIGYSSNK